MMKTIFDDLLPPPQELDVFVATAVLGWQDIRWHHTGYVGMPPSGTVETPLPCFTAQEDLVASVQAALRSRGQHVQVTPVPEGWRAQVGEDAVTSRTLPLALCAAAWRALHKE